ncbi:hypothetical protein D3C79_755890 [compost metagenome]
MAHRQVLAIQTATVAAVVHIGVMQVHELIIAASHQDPVRCLETREAVAANQHERPEPRLQRRTHIKAGRQDLLHVGLTQRLDKTVLHEFHDGFFLRAAHAIEKQRVGLAEHHAHLEPPTPGRESKTLRAATAVAGGHEDGRRLTPELDFFGPQQ